MSDRQPIQSGDRIDITHDGGSRSWVTLVGADTKNKNLIDVKWKGTHSQNYKIDLRTRYLMVTMSKKTHWRVSEETATDLRLFCSEEPKSLMSMSTIERMNIR